MKYVHKDTRLGTINVLSDGLHKQEELRERAARRAAATAKWRARGL